MEVLVGQRDKILSEEQQVSLPTLEEPRSVEVDDMELHELVFKEEGSTSLESIEIIKEVEILLAMILWGEVHEKLENKKMTPISKVDEPIFELNENLRATMVKKLLTSLGEHATMVTLKEVS